MYIRWIFKLTGNQIEHEYILLSTGSVAEPEPVLFGRSRSRCKGLAPTQALAPGSGSTIDKTD